MWTFKILFMPRNARCAKTDSDMVWSSCRTVQMPITLMFQLHLSGFVLLYFCYQTWTYKEILLFLWIFTWFLQLLTHFVCWFLVSVHIFVQVTIYLRPWFLWPLIADFKTRFVGLLVPLQKIIFCPSLYYTLYTCQRVRKVSRDSLARSTKYKSLSSYSQSVRLTS